MATQKKISDIKAINVHAGHNLDGKIACGAVGLIKESTEDRIVKDKVITMLRILGYTVYDCTCDNGTDKNDVLKKIVKKCNAHKADLDVSIHFNSGASDKSGNGKTTGVEVLVLPGSTLKNIASGICESISDLGFRNRGVKERTDLYVLNRTNASALLVECCFVDDADDVKLYNGTKMAEAIVYGITGRRYTYGSDQQVSSSTSSTPAASVRKYYPKYTGKSVSVVDALKAVGEKDTTLAHRKKIAAANGISGYSGTANQNTKILTLLKQGKLTKA